MKNYQALTNAERIELLKVLTNLCEIDPEYIHYSHCEDDMPELGFGLYGFYIGRILKDFIYGDAPEPSSEV